MKIVDEDCGILSRELIAWPVWKFCPVVLQLAWPFNSPACFTRVPPLATCQSWGRVARTSCLIETWLFTFHTHPTINILIPTKCRELLERIFREKNKINSSHPLHWYILERYISQNPYLIIPISMRKLFGAWEAVQKGPIHFGWCNGLLWDPVS